MSHFRNWLIAIGCLCALIPYAEAQLREQPVTTTAPNSTDVVRLEKSIYGLLPAKRVSIAAGESANGRAAMLSVSTSSIDGAISPSLKGVIYNYAMQKYGLFSGEISFAVQSGSDVSAFKWDANEVPHPLGPQDVYVVNVGSGAAFVRVFNMLSTTKAIKWVEPSIEYVNQTLK